ncbi:MAG: hypothetical protein FD130_172 [Halothiobacillaceae bacterium]|nr:MAG: hypothetical protein FD130_172 [Halothiobacillaceae bacterium]
MTAIGVGVAGGSRCAYLSDLCHQTITDTQVITVLGLRGRDDLLVEITQVGASGSTRGFSEALPVGIVRRLARQLAIVYSRQDDRAEPTGQCTWFISLYLLKSQ